MRNVIYEFPSYESLQAALKEVTERYGPTEVSHSGTGLGYTTKIFENARYPEKVHAVLVTYGGKPKE